MNNLDSSTMFAHIVPHLTNRTEDVAVEVLGFILSRSDAARRALKDMVELEGMEVGELTDAGTQVGERLLFIRDYWNLGPYPMKLYPRG